MIWKFTPPVSPQNDITDEDEEEDMLELNENDIAEVISLDENESTHDDEDEIDETLEDFTPVRDDATTVFTKHEKSVLSCCLHPQHHNIAATGGIDDIAYVWDINTCEVLLTCDEHMDSVDAVAFSSDGSYLATGDLGGNIKIWKMADYTLAGSIELADELRWMEWHRGTNVLVAASNIGMVQMFKIPSCESKMVLPGYGKDCPSGKILPDGKRLACGYEDGTLKFCDMKQGTVLQEVKQQSHQSPVNCIDAYKDNNLVICGSEDGQVILVKSQTGKVASILNGYESAHESLDSVESVSFCKDPSFPVAASGSLAGDLVIWDITKQTQRHNHAFDSGINKLIWAPDKPLVYTCHIEGIARLYDTRNGSVVREFFGHRNRALSMDLSQNGSVLITTSEDKTARVYKTESC